MDNEHEEFDDKTGRPLICLLYGQTSVTPSLDYNEYIWCKSSGGDAENTTLTGYLYDDGNYYTDGDLLISRSAVVEWSNYLAKGGEIIRTINYDIPYQGELLEAALADLKHFEKPEINYDVELYYHPGNIAIGDRVNIVDREGSLYISARILKMTESDDEDSLSITLGDFLIEESGITDEVQNLANAFRRFRTQHPHYTWIVYASDENGTDISTESGDLAWMGILENQLTSTPDLSDPSRYTWTKVKGEDGYDGSLIAVSSNEPTAGPNDTFIFNKTDFPAEYQNSIKVGDVVFAGDYRYVVQSIEGSVITCGHKEDLKGLDGQDGYSPTVSIVENANREKVVTITDASGNHSTTIMDGATIWTTDREPSGPTTMGGKEYYILSPVYLDGDGPTKWHTKDYVLSNGYYYYIDSYYEMSGETMLRLTNKTKFEGQDGYSPTVSIDDSTSGQSTITITDVNGDHSTTIYDGQDGVDGTAFYGIVYTSSSTSQKLVEISDTGFDMHTGVLIAVKFVAGNTATTMQLSINSATAVNVTVNNSLNVDGKLTIPANTMVTFAYDGTNFVYISSDNLLNEMRWSENGGLNIYAQSGSNSRVQITNDSVNIYDSNGNLGTRTDTSGMAVYENNEQAAKFGNYITIGKENSAKIIVGNHELSGYNEKGTPIFEFGPANSTSSFDGSEDSSYSMELSKKYVLKNTYINDIDCEINVTCKKHVGDPEVIGFITYFTYGVDYTDVFSESSEIFRVIYDSNENTISVTGETLDPEYYAHSWTVKLSGSISNGTTGYFTLGSRSSGQIGSYSATIGEGNLANGINTLANGINSTASGSNSHAEGNGTVASGSNSHAEGNGTVASGSNSHAEGYQTMAITTHSHAEGCGTIAAGVNQHVIGQYNKLHLTRDGALFVIGNGGEDSNRSDALIAYDTGNVSIALSSSENLYSLINALEWDNEVIE